MEYTKICFDIPKEAKKIVCFPPGGGSEGGLLEEMNLFEEDVIDDRDNDRLPDTWEERFNCDATRTAFINSEDEKNCKELLGNNGENKLNPDNIDSDGDRVNDGSEDPDKDGYNNYQEYIENGHPNKASVTLDGTNVQTNCYAEFSDFSIKGGSQITGIESVGMKFVPGEKVILQLNGLQITGGSVKEDEILVRTEVSGPRLFSLLDDTTFNDGRSDFVVWNIDNSPSTAVYDVKVQLMVPGKFGGGELCRDKQGVIAEKTKKILVYNSNKGGCLDSDEGANYDVDGVCVDSNGVNVDKCENNQAVDYFCKNGKCEMGTKTCGDGNSCNKGKCTSVCFDNDKNNDIGTYGICKYLDLKTNTWKISGDECSPNIESNGIIFEFKCGNSGVCEQEIKSCASETLCKEKTIKINFPQASISNKRFDVGICAKTIGANNEFTILSDLSVDQLITLYDELPEGEDKERVAEQISIRSGTPEDLLANLFGQT